MAALVLILQTMVLAEMVLVVALEVFTLAP
jgi:hypothetical protein